MIYAVASVAKMHFSNDFCLKLFRIKELKTPKKDSLKINLMGAQTRLFLFDTIDEAKDYAIYQAVVSGTQNKDKNYKLYYMPVFSVNLVRNPTVTIEQKEVLHWDISECLKEAARDFGIQFTERTLFMQSCDKKDIQFIQSAQVFNLYNRNSLLYPIQEEIQPCNLHYVSN